MVVYSVYCVNLQAFPAAADWTGLYPTDYGVDFKVQNRRKRECFCVLKQQQQLSMVATS